jgi:oligopeptide/dipeptide ABC transporter ATP-binding protein
MEPILEICDLSVDYRTPRGTVHALRRVSLKVPRGKVVGIVGESGCGKSTLLGSIIRLLPPSSTVTGGQILFEGRNLLSLGQESMRRLRGDRISTVFQDPMTSLNPVHSIGWQMVDIQFREKLSRREKRARAAEMLAQVGIPDPMQRLDQYPHEFSGGMRQRIAIAMALLSNPDLLIADEPTTALDVSMEAQIMHLLRELQQRVKASVLLITHHLGLVAELCDHVVVMYAGEVVEAGGVEQVLLAPRHPYTRALLDCDPARITTPTRSLPTIAGEVPNLQSLSSGCIFAPRCSDAIESCRSALPPMVQLEGLHQARCQRIADGQPA